MDTNITISYITINYNSSEDTIELLESVDESASLEFVIVDNNSNLNDYRKLESYIIKTKFNFKVKLHRLEENIGFSAGNNFALKYVDKKSDYILIGNNDLILNKNSISELLNRAIKDNATVATSTVCYNDRRNIVWYGGGSESIEPKFKKRHLNQGTDLTNLNLQSEAQKVTFVSGAWFLFKKSLLDKTYLFDENIFFGEEDADLCIRLRKIRVDLYYYSDLVVYHKVGVTKNSRINPILNLFHVSSKIYNVAKNYSPIYSFPYLFAFLIYQNIAMIKAKDTILYLFKTNGEILSNYFKGLLGRYKKLDRSFYSKLSGRYEIRK